MAKAGLQAIYLSGWQVAADANISTNTYPDQSLYPANSAPMHVQRLNNALMRADQIAKLEGVEEDIDYFLPIVADAEAGFGGALNAYELMRHMVGVNIVYLFIRRFNYVCRKLFRDLLELVIQTLSLNAYSFLLMKQYLTSYCQQFSNPMCPKRS